MNSQSTLTFGASGCAFLQWFWFVLRAYCRGRGSHSEPCLPLWRWSWQTGGAVRRDCSHGKLANSWQMVLSARVLSRKSRNHRINTGQLNRRGNKHHFLGANCNPLLQTILSSSPARSGAGIPARKIPLLSPTALTYSKHPALHVSFAFVSSNLRNDCARRQNVANL